MTAIIGTTRYHRFVGNHLRLSGEAIITQSSNRRSSGASAGYSGRHGGGDTLGGLGPAVRFDGLVGGPTSCPAAAAHSDCWQTSVTSSGTCVKGLEHFQLSGFHYGC